MDYSAGYVWMCIEPALCALSPISPARTAAPTLCTWVRLRGGADEYTHVGDLVAAAGVGGEAPTIPTEGEQDADGVGALATRLAPALLTPQ